MLKRKLIVLILLAVVVSGRAYAQEEMPYDKMRTISGKVVTADQESGLLSVQIDDVRVEFYITTKSSLHMTVHAMSVLDISAGDPVTIQYVNVSGKHYVVNLVDNKEESS